MATTEERLTKLETAVFGPVAPSGEGSSATPGVPTAPKDGSGIVPWNRQPGEGKPIYFQGDTDVRLVPEDNYSGPREMAVDQIAPQWESVLLTLDNDPADLAGNNGNGFISPAPFKVWFENGQPRVLHIRPKPGTGSGEVRFRGGYN